MKKQKLIIQFEKIFDMQRTPWDNKASISKLVGALKESHFKCRNNCILLWRKNTISWKRKVNYSKKFELKKCKWKTKQNSWCRKAKSHIFYDSRNWWKEMAGDEASDLRKSKNNKEHMCSPHVWILSYRSKWAVVFTWRRL